MIQLTEKPVCFNDGPSAYWGHLYLGKYANGTISLVAGEDGKIGKLSVNLVDFADDLKPSEFFVKKYSDGTVINWPCFETGLFEIAGEEFVIGPFNSPFQRWRIKDEVWRKILPQIKDE